MTTLAALIAMSTISFAGPRVLAANPRPQPNPALDAPDAKLWYPHTGLNHHHSHRWQLGSPGWVFHPVDDIGGLPSKRWRLAYGRNSFL